MTCPRCGAGVANDVAFCLYCGKQIRAVPKQAPEAATPVDPVIQEGRERSGGFWVSLVLVFIAVAFAVTVIFVFSATRRKTPNVAASGVVAAERMGRRLDLLKGQIDKYRAERGTTSDAVDQAERQVLRTRAILHELQGLTNAFDIAAKEDSMLRSYRVAKDMVSSALGTSGGE